MRWERESEGGKKETVYELSTYKVMLVRKFSHNDDECGRLSNKNSDSGFFYAAGPLNLWDYVLFLQITPRNRQMTHCYIYCDWRFFRHGVEESVALKSQTMYLLSLPGLCNDTRYFSLRSFSLSPILLVFFPSCFSVRLSVSRERSLKLESYLFYWYVHVLLLFHFQ